MRLTWSPEGGVAPEQTLAIAYSPARARAGLRALFALDARLGQVLAGTSDAMIGQLRFTWWHDALARLDTAPPPAEPVLRALAAEVLPLGVTGGQLTRLVEGWEELLDLAEADAVLLRRYAEGRAALFVAAGAVAGAGPRDPLAVAGAGWALVELGRHGSGPVAAEAVRIGRELLAETRAVRWSREGRGLGTLAALARRDADAWPGRAGAWGKLGRALLLRVAGR